MPLSLLLFAQCTRLESGADTFGPAAAGGRSEGGGAAGGNPANNGGTASSAGGSGGGSVGVSGATAQGGVGGDSCIDPSGFDGLGCRTCEPTEIVEFEAACSDVECKLFDNRARLTLLPSNGKLPPLPVSPAAGGAASDGGSGGAAGALGAAGIGGGGAAAGAPGGGRAGSGGSAGHAGSLGAGGSVASGSACSELASSASLVYVTGSSAAKPYLQQIAQQLVSRGVYLVYTSTGSCVGVDAILNGTPMTSGAAPAPAATATYWDSPASTGKACDLPPSGVSADIGVSDVFAQSCPGFELAALDSLRVRDAHGPIQTMSFAVPVNSPYSEISAQAAYFVFGFGEAGGVRDAQGRAMWNDEDYLFQRSASSGTQALISAAIGVPAGAFRGKPHKSSDEMATDLQNAGADATNARKAIGILAADYIDSKNLRAQLRMLAFQDTRQPCAVFPDSTATAHDKANVRDGHYPLWGPLHLLYRVDAAGNPADESKRQMLLDIIGYLAGSKSLPNGVSLLDVYAQSGLIPECAMRVSRTKDGGNLAPFRASTPCSCSFEARATGATACRSCSVQGDCRSGESCSLGYCEP